MGSLNLIVGYFWTIQLTLKQFCLKGDILNQSKRRKFPPRWIGIGVHCNLHGVVLFCRDLGIVNRFQVHSGNDIIINVCFVIRKTHYHTEISMLSQLFNNKQIVLITFSPEPSLFAHIKYGSRRRVRPKIRHLAPLDGCACVFEEWVYGGRKVP